MIFKIFFLIHIIENECLEGCLKCNSRDDCLFCDATQNYSLDTNTCKKIIIDNCDIIDLG